MNDTVKQLARNLLTPHPEVDARIEHGIELHRKGTASFTVADAKGAKVPGAEVTFTLKRHDFDFGCNAFPWPRRMRETVAIDSPVWRATTLSETAPSGAWNP